MKRVVTSLALFVLLFSAVPRVINYQGKLTTVDGVGVNDTLGMVFRLYTSESGGSALWEETQEVIVRNGLFSAFLGNVVPFPDSVDFSVPYWLEVVVNGEVMEPRERLVSVPYAIRAREVERAIQAVASTEDGTRRRGTVLFAPYGDATLTDGGDSIIIAIGGAGGGATTPNLTQVLAVGRDAGSMRIENLGEPTARDHAATRGFVEDYVSARDGYGLSFTDNRFNVNVDGATIRIVNDTIMLAPGAITSALIASGAVTSAALAPGAVNASAIDWASVMAVIRDSLEGAPAEGLTQYYTAGENIYLRDAVFLNSNPYFVRVFTTASLPRSQMFNLMIPIELGSSFAWAHTTSDGRDIRILDSDRRTSLPYWYEVWSPAEGRARIWVKTRYLNNGADTLYIYYGDPALGAMSNPDSTLLFGDHFDGTTLRSGWSASGTYYLSGSNIWLVTSSSTLTRNYTLLDTFALSWRAKITDSLQGSYVGATVNTQPTYFYAAPSGPGWCKVYGWSSEDQARALVPIPDGNYYIVGGSTTGAGGWDYCVMKVNSYGDTLWTKTFGSGNDDFPPSAVATSDSGCVVAGYRYLGYNRYNGWILRLNKLGNIVWSNDYYLSTSNYYRTYFHSLNSTSDGGFIVGGCYGYYYDSYNRWHQTLVLKLTSSGAVSWGRLFPSGGSNGWEYFPYGILQADDGGYIICGQQYYYYPYTEYSRGYLIRLNSSGNLVWDRYYCPYGSNGQRSYLMGVTSMPDGGFITVGSTNQYGSGSYDILVIRVNSTGNTVWAKVYGGGGEDHGRNIIRTSDGNLVISGYTTSYTAGGRDIIVLKIDQSGNLIWARTYGSGSDDYAEGWSNALYERSDSTLMLASFGASYSFGSHDFYLLRLGKNGFACFPLLRPFTGYPTPNVVDITSTIVQGSIGFSYGSTGCNVAGFSPTVYAQRPNVALWGVPLFKNFPSYFTRYGSSYDSTNVYFTPDDYRTFTLRKLGSTLQYEIDSTVVRTVTGISQGITQFNANGPNLYIDNLVFRKAVLSDPSIAFSSEQNPGQSIFRATALSQFAASSFLGIAVESAAEGDTNVAVRVSGPVSGFGSLFPGATYYLSDEAGAISRAPGTISRIVGTAIDADVLNVNR